MVRRGLFHDFPGEIERSLRSQNEPALLCLQTDRPDHVLKFPGFRAGVVSPMGRLKMFIAGLAVEHHVTVRNCLARIRVVGNFIGMQNVCAIVNFDLPAQFVNVAVDFLLLRMNGYFLTVQRRRRIRDALH